MPILDAEDARLWTTRNILQGELTEKALMQRWQTSFDRPRKELPFLSNNRRLYMTYGNPHSHNLMFRTLAGTVFKSLGIIAPNYAANQPFFLISLSDRTMNWVSPELFQAWYNAWLFHSINEDDRVAEKVSSLMAEYSPSISEIRANYANLLQSPDLHWVGMVEPAMYVYSRKCLGYAPVLHFHQHRLAWGISEDELRALISQKPAGVRALLPRAKTIHVERVRKLDLRQVLWYLTKAPRTQYQLRLRESGSFHQYSGKINGVNSVRVYHAMKGTFIDDLIDGGGLGADIISDFRLRLELARARRA